MFRRSWRLPLFAAGLLYLARPSAASATPVEGEAAIEGEGREARDKAIRAARHAAFDAAVAELGGSVDAAALDAARRSVDVWTSSYRVLEIRPDGVRVEVDVDLARLAKRVSPSVQARPWRVELGEVDVDAACDAGLAERAPWLEGLSAAGLPLEAKAEAGAQSLSLGAELRCRVLGPVMATHLVAARVELSLSSQGRNYDAAGVGFAVDLPGALAAARNDALAKAAVELDAALAAPKILRVMVVEDGARVRRLERAIREGVVGARAVRVHGIEAGGVVQLAVDTELGLDALAQRLSALEFPDFSLSVTRPPGQDAIDVDFY